MEAFRTVQQVQNSQILIQLPDTFSDKRVEVIVLPLQYKNEEQNLDRKNILKKSFLEGPTWSDKDYEYFLDTTKELREWGMKEY
jgi:hypothetical protein